jgi:hypothetical protein
MASSGTLRRVAVFRTEVSEEFSAFFIRGTRIGELGTLAVTSVRRLLVTASVVPSSPILVPLMKEALNTSEMSILTRATRHNIPEDAILYYWSALINWSYKNIIGRIFQTKAAVG